MNIKKNLTMLVISCNSLNCTCRRGTANADKSVVDSLLNIGRSIIPINIVSAAATPNFLGVITFAIIFAAALVRFGILPLQLVVFAEVRGNIRHLDVFH